MSKLGLESLTLQIQQQVKAWDQKKIRIHITYPQQTDRRRQKKKKQPSNFSHLTMKSERYTHQPECKEEDKVR